MKLSKSTKEKLIKIAKELREDWETCDWEYVGVRVQEQPFEMGAINHNSMRWIDGDMTDEELPGTCCVNPNLLFANTVQYDGDHVALIAGNSFEVGQDVGEIIIPDAKVIYILQ